MMEILEGVVVRMKEGEDDINRTTIGWIASVALNGCVDEVDAVRKASARVVGEMLEG